MPSDLVSELITRQIKAAPAQLAELAGQVVIAPFASDLLEVDEPLWGSFWQGDVIAPGYSLPAVELALLRATRLDHTWPEETSVAQFLADLRQAISHPQAGIWTLTLAGEPWVVFAAKISQGLITVVWYCATTERLHAGYRTAAKVLQLAGAAEQRAPEWIYQQSTEIELVLDWLQRVVEQVDETGARSMAARFDAEILQMRLMGSS